MDEIAVSVIMPSLNVASYIENCLQSVLRQTLRKIEILCVDAGSDDGTLSVLRAYEDADSRIQVLLSNRKSYGYQVNLGLEKARGKYIGIVDTDDCIPPEMYETLYRLAEGRNLDFIKADYYGFFENEAGEYHKRLYRQLQKKEDYNRTLNIAKHQECFQPEIAAVWSGIYKRDFLKSNNIYCNETDGASFQDTGFWFQTYAFAQRAYFMDTPLYLYRLDNPDASTYSSGKVTSICDELGFVYRRLTESDILPIFQDTFSKIFYRKYKRNMERISEEYREGFMVRFAEDFRTLRENGMLSDNAFEQEAWEEINRIMREPTVYYRDILKRKDDFLQKLEEAGEIIIYGAGKVGQEILRKMKETSQVLGFAVSDKEGNEKMIMGKPVMSIDELGKYGKAVQVVIAVKAPENRKKMISQARQNGIEKIIIPPYGILDY